MIPDQGTLSEMASAKLMLALHEQNKTGILYFRQNEILKVFYLNRGRISWAISSDEEDKIDHVLLAKKLVMPEILAPYQAGNKIAETFGKVLVENGVITLEVLIQATREQVRRIATGVLRWSSGNYQLVPEPPPTRLVSLDVDIPSLVAQYILSQMDVNIVWEELGSLSGELQLNPDPGKKGIYPLDSEQQGILYRFRQPQRLEAVLLDFPAEGKYRILKMLYYFVLSGLLIRKEPEKAPSLDFKELDSLFGQSPANSPADVDIEMPAMIDEAAIQDIPQTDLSEITVERAAADEPENAILPDLMPPEGFDEPSVAPRATRETENRAAEERPRPHPFRVPEKQKPRWLTISFLSILLTAALIGLFLWLTRSPVAPGRTDATPAAVPPKALENADPQAHSAGKAGEEKADPPGEGSATESSADAAATETPADILPTPTVNRITEKAKPGADESAPAAGGSSARELFDAGNFRAAGQVWREEIISMQVKFTILLEMDCLPESVRSAYRQVDDKANFFLLNKTNRDGRFCWLVLWGRYRTLNEAELGLKLVPEYFLKQSSPPAVIELAPYL